MSRNILILKTILSFCLLAINCAQDPDAYITTTKLIESKGYLAEEHSMLTQDGYILTVHRIINPNMSSVPKKVAFLQHGLLDASSTWVVNFPTQSLGFILADKGFDVWLGNVRGNTYSNYHIKYNKNEEEFWNFSFDEMAKHDLTAMIDYILLLTNNSNLFYVGHSQGTMVAFAKLSLEPEFQSKIKLFLALGPVATVGSMQSPIKYLAEIGKSSDQNIWYSLFGKKSFLPSTNFVQILADQLCKRVSIDKLICDNIIGVLCGPSKNFNETRMPVYVTHAPAGTSTKNMIHFAQMAISKTFQMYDYGSDNILHYNQSTAPLYDVKNIKTPVALYYGQDDWLADPTDVEYLKNNLPNIKDDFIIEKWDHLDFVWAQNASQVLYNRMIQLMYSFN